MGQRGGRQAPVTIADSVEGIVNIIRIALSTQGKRQVGLTEKQPGPMDAKMEEFTTQLKEKNCVFVDYQGEVLPW